MPPVQVEMPPAPNAPADAPRRTGLLPRGVRYMHQINGVQAFIIWAGVTVGLSMALTSLFRLILQESVGVGFFLWLMLCDLAFMGLCVLFIGGSVDHLMNRTALSHIGSLVFAFIAVNLMESQSLTKEMLLQMSKRTPAAYLSSAVRLFTFQQISALGAVHMYLTDRQLPWKNFFTDIIAAPGIFTSGDATVAHRRNVTDPPCRISKMSWAAVITFVFQGIAFAYAMARHSTESALRFAALSVLAVLSISGGLVCISDRRHNRSLTNDLGYQVMMLHVSNFVPYLVTADLETQLPMHLRVIGMLGLLFILTEGAQFAAVRAAPLRAHLPYVFVLMVFEDAMLGSYMNNATKDEMPWILLIAFLFQLLTHSNVWQMRHWLKHKEASPQYSPTQDLELAYTALSQRLCAHVGVVIVFFGMLVDWWLPGECFHCLGQHSPPNLLILFQLALLVSRIVVDFLLMLINRAVWHYVFDQQPAEPVDPLESIQDMQPSVQPAFITVFLNHVRRYAPLFSFCCMHMFAWMYYSFWNVKVKNM